MSIEVFTNDLFEAFQGGRKYSYKIESSGVLQIFEERSLSDQLSATEDVLVAEYSPHFWRKVVTKDD